MIADVFLAGAVLLLMEIAKGGGIQYLSIFSAYFHLSAMCVTTKKCAPV